MQISVQIAGRICQIDTEKFFDLSIPLNFNGEQPNAYGAARAFSEPCKAGMLVGDTRQGGSCNFEQYTFIPHCNGTHTESIGHITNERISILDSLRDVLIPAMLISVEPENALSTGESYSVELEPADRMLTKRQVEDCIMGLKNEDPDLALRGALIIRTLPNDDRKKMRDYMKEPPPFFSLEAIEYVANLAFQHLLVDLPSIDRTFDEGKLSAHRIFWNMPPQGFEIKAESRRHRTITEMIYVPNEIEDGPYLLNLQIAPFASDAAPSRPILFKYDG